MSRRAELEARVTRSMIQNMHVVGANFNARTSAWTIRVKGASGDRVYRVVFRTDATSCTCPDFFSRGGDHCKHIFFIVNRVLEDRRLAARMIDSPKYTPVNQLEPRVSEQFYYIFFDGIPSQTATATNATRDADAASLGAIQEEYDEDIDHNEDIDQDEDEDERAHTQTEAEAETCAVCLDPLPAKHNRDRRQTQSTSAVQRAHERAREREERVWACRQCKNRLHHHCFQAWYFRAPGPGAPKCPLCRAPTVVWDQRRFHLFQEAHGESYRSTRAHFTSSPGIASALGIGAGIAPAARYQA